MPLPRTPIRVEVLVPEQPLSRKYSAAFERRHSDIARLAQQDPERLSWLQSIFSSSRFLSEDLLQHPGWIFDLDAMGQTLSAAEYGGRLTRFLNDLQDEASIGEHLALFRRRELLRIVVRDQLQLGTLPQVTEELSNLADAILSHALEVVNAKLEARFGQPLSAGSERAVLSVLAVGKLGGRELNYSSDIDLIFVYSANGSTSGPEQISNGEYFKKVANQLTRFLSAYTPAGQCYRLDLRLRPEGSHGEVCISLPAAKEYYAKRARDWELQMLLKARVAAGDDATGAELLASVEPLIYSTTLDFSTIEAMSATRERISEKMARRRSKSRSTDVKLTPGGIRDIEFLVQCLQRLHGNRRLAVKDRGTLPALARLYANSLLSSTEFHRLSDAYLFLRRVEHVLQFENDRQTHSLPTDTVGLEALAQRVFRIDTSAQEGQGSTRRFLENLKQHLENVRSIYERIVHAQRSMPYSLALAERTAEAPPAAGGSGFEDFRASLQDRPAEFDLIQKASTGRDAAPPDERGTSADLGRAHSRFGASCAISREGESVLRASSPRESRVAIWTARLFEYCPLLSDQLVRSPGLLHEIKKTADDPSRRYAFEALAPPLDDVAGLRRFFSRQMFRIQVASVCLPEAIFATLDQTSALAEFVIARAYRVALEMSLEHARSKVAHGKSFEEPQAEMMVVALGRLGMREFDIGSDADLLFIIPETETIRQRFWTRVAERLLDILSAYEGGRTISVDTRLRPNGREGMLVQSESKYVEYFSDKAEAWEGIAYMKARAVAGDTDRATRFLTELQQVDWRRYGQGGRSKHDLQQMRLRLEREQASAAPLKAALGGYYDADFILMYLRLRGAGLFFKSLNTPERIDIVEKMGHLDRPDADFLSQATTHFRALDHALRLVTGHAGGKVPEHPKQREMVAHLLTLWTGHPSKAETLDAELATLQAQMHRLFESVFAA